MTVVGSRLLDGVLVCGNRSTDIGNGEGGVAGKMETAAAAMSMVSEEEEEEKILASGAVVSVTGKVRNASDVGTDTGCCGDGSWSTCIFRERKERSNKYNAGNMWIYNVCIRDV